MSTAGSVHSAQLADRLAIHDLIATYNRHLDDGRVDLLADLFTDDGVLTAMGKRAEGRPAIRAMFGSPADPLPTRPTMSHQVSNTLAEIDGDLASAQSDLVVFSRGDDGFRIMLVGRYHDMLRRTADGWRFSNREPVMLARQPTTKQ